MDVAVRLLDLTLEYQHAVEVRSVENAALQVIPDGREPTIIAEEYGATLRTFLTR